MVCMRSSFPILIAEAAKEIVPLPEPPASTYKMPSCVLILGLLNIETWYLYYILCIFIRNVCKIIQHFEWLVTKSGFELMLLHGLFKCILLVPNVVRIPRADHISAQNLKGVCSSSSAAPFETIQSPGDGQNTPLSFSCRTNRHPVAF